MNIVFFRFNVSYYVKVKSVADLNPPTQSVTGGWRAVSTGWPACYLSAEKNAKCCLESF